MAEKPAPTLQNYAATSLPDATRAAKIIVANHLKWFWSRPMPERLLLAGQRASSFEFGGRDQLSELHLRLLGELQGIVDLDPDISVLFTLRDGRGIPGPSIDRRSSGAPQRRGAVCSGVQPNRLYPGPYDPGILPGRKMDMRLGRGIVPASDAVAIQLVTASRVCLVISNWIGR